MVYFNIFCLLRNEWMANFCNDNYQVRVAQPVVWIIVYIRIFGFNSLRLASNLITTVENIKVKVYLIFCNLENIKVLRSFPIKKKIKVLLIEIYCMNLTLYHYHKVKKNISISKYLFTFLIKSHRLKENKTIMKIYASGLALTPFVASLKERGGFGDWSQITFVQCDDTTNCLNGSTCRDIDGESEKRCDCDRTQFDGFLCQLDKNATLPCDRPENQNVCQQGGTCVNDWWEADANGLGTYYCNCPKNYAGQNCEIYLGFDLPCDDLDSACNSHANHCINQIFNKQTGWEVYQSEFVIGGNGDRLNKDYCQGYDCEADNWCVCDANWSGKDCENFVGPPCEKEMKTFDDHQACIDEIFKKVEAIEGGEFTWYMNKKIKKINKKLAGKD